MRPLVVAILVGFFQTTLPAIAASNSATSRLAGQMAEAAKTIPDSLFILHSSDSDVAFSGWFSATCRESCTRIASFFDTSWIHPFDIYLYSDRASIDKQWQQDWGMPDFKSECWMVASGIGTRLDYLSPHAWRTEACEHDADDTLEWKEILTHELTHVFNGQHNPVPDFTGLDSIGWLVEGLAVLVSGQLDAERLTQAHDAVANHQIPSHLADFWSGSHRYAICGSLVHYIDQAYGRQTIRRLLCCVSEEQVLAILGITESELIENWKTSLVKGD